MRKTGVPGEEPAEASLDWKPNGHNSAGTGNRTRAPVVHSAEEVPLRCLLPQSLDYIGICMSYLGLITLH